MKFYKVYTFDYQKYSKCELYLEFLIRQRIPFSVTHTDNNAVLSLSAANAEEARYIMNSLIQTVFECVSEATALQFTKSCGDRN